MCCLHAGVNFQPALAGKCIGKHLLRGSQISLDTTLTSCKGRDLMRGLERAQEQAKIMDELARLSEEFKLMDFWNTGQARPEPLLSAAKAVTLARNNLLLQFIYAGMHGMCASAPVLACSCA